MAYRAKFQFCKMKSSVGGIYKCTVCPTGSQENAPDLFYALTRLLFTRSHKFLKVHRLVHLLFALKLISMMDSKMKYGVEKQEKGTESTEKIPSLVQLDFPSFLQPFPSFSSVPLRQDGFPADCIIFNPQAKLLDLVHLN